MAPSESRCCLQAQLLHRCRCLAPPRGRLAPVAAAPRRHWLLPAAPYPDPLPPHAAAAAACCPPAVVRASRGKPPPLPAVGRTAPHPVVAACCRCRPLPPPVCRSRGCCGPRRPLAACRLCTAAAAGCQTVPSAVASAGCARHCPCVPPRCCRRALPPPPRIVRPPHRHRHGSRLPPAAATDAAAAVAWLPRDATSARNPLPSWRHPLVAAATADCPPPKDSLLLRPWPAAAADCQLPRLPPHVSVQG